MFSSWASHSPGAVPFGLSNTSAPAGTRAWRALLAGMAMDLCTNRSLSFSSTPSFKTN